MNFNSKIFIAGHNGLVGSALYRKLKELGFTKLITRTSDELDLSRQKETEEFFDEQQPDFVFLSAAKVGGIWANKIHPADFIYKNILIEANVINSSFLSNTKKLLFLGSSCIYPKLVKQPIKEEYLLSGSLESTNEAYAIAKIAGIKMCEYYNKQYETCFISVMPTNLYGINDNFDLEKSHVVPAMIRKFHEAKTQQLKNVVLWGTGSPKREFLYVDDLADACIFLMKNYYENEIINIGAGVDISIKDLASLIKRVVGYDGEIIWDHSKPDGTPQKLLNIEKIQAMGWIPKSSLEEGLKITYNWYLNNH